MNQNDKQDLAEGNTVFLDFVATNPGGYLGTLTQDTADFTGPLKVTSVDEPNHEGISKVTVDAIPAHKDAAPKTLKIDQTFLSLTPPLQL